MRYYIPVNKIPIQCTYDTCLYFKPVVYEEGERIKFIGNASIGNEFCFIIITSSWRKSFDDYDQAYEFYKKSVVERERYYARFYSGRFDKR